MIFTSNAFLSNYPSYRENVVLLNILDLNTVYSYFQLQRLIELNIMVLLKSQDKVKMCDKNQLQH